MLRLEDVTKAYGSRRVLDSVNAAFHRNAVNFLMGPNGAGKTTLICCVLGLHAYHGTIMWGGRPVDPAERLVFPVFDDAPFHPRLSGRQNLQETNRPTAWTGTR
jgi:ABC-type multidrug transport system ATPase subunit